MNLLTVRQCAIGFLALIWLIPFDEAVLTGATSGIQEIQGLYDQKEYQKVLEELTKLDSHIVGAPDIRRLKIRTLLRLGKPKDALSDYDNLVQLLKADDQSILQEVALAFVVVLAQDMREQMRGVAYTALKEWQSPDAIPFLQDGLNDGSGLVRALAAEGLAKLDGGRRSARFRQALDDQAALVKEAVLKGLGKSGDASVIGLVEPLLQDPEVRVRVAAAEAMCRLGRKQGCALLERSGKAPNPDERGAAIRALVDLRGASVLPLLIDASQHKQPSVRGVAAMGFGNVSAPQALTVLSRLLRDPLPPVRVAAAVSLGHLQGADARSPLRKAIAEDPDASVKAFVIGALLEQGERYDELSDPVSALASAKELAVRTALARALGRASKENRVAAHSALRALFADTMPRVRIATLKSMAKLDGGEAVPILKQGLYDEDDAVRATAGGELLHVMSMRE